MSTPKTPGLIELPGMKGTITIHYDLSTGAVGLEAQQIAIPQVIQLLLVAAQGAVNEWSQIDAGIIRPKGTSTDGNEEKTSKENDDDNNG